MRAAVISDIHGNWEALEAVWADIQAVQADVVYCLGDIVGYGADPRLCWQWVTQHCLHSVRGNHDEALSGNLAAGMNAYAAAAIRWTTEQFTAAEILALSSYPLVYSGADARLVHGSPQEPKAFHYTRSRLDIESAFQAFPEPLCLIGHTHIPMVAEEIVPGTMRMLAPLTIPIDPEHRYLVNVGSVGQPRDGNPCARWVLIDSERARLTFRMVDYDISKAQQKIKNAGLPEILADRLGQGI